MSNDVMTAILRVVRQMPVGHVESFANCIDVLPAYGPEAGSALNAVAAPTYRENAQSILSAWSREPRLSGNSIALALRVGMQARQDADQAETVEIVWTGPTSRAIPMRRTREVLLDLIDGSESRLLVVSFAAYKVPEVLSAIHGAAVRGVDVRLILETTAESSGRLTHDASDAFASLGPVVSFYVWPREKRAIASDMPGNLHAKAVVADERVAFVTSANLTGHALSANIELGILVHGGSVPSRLTSHFDELLAQGTLTRVAH